MLAEFDAVRLDELVAMWRASFEAGVGVTDPHPIAAQKDYFVTQVLPRNSLRVELQDGNVVGFIAASRESIAQLYVRMGQGAIGRKPLALYVRAQSGSAKVLRARRLPRRRARLRANVAAGGHQV